MIHVLIVDDFPIVRQGVRRILEEFPQEFMVMEEGDGSVAVNTILKNSFDVILLDISMPGKNGLELLKEIKMAKPDLAVLMLSMYPEEQYATRALKLGAAGYLPKSNASEELVIAVRKAALGKKYISPMIEEKLIAGLSNFPSFPDHHILSDRELEVMRMIAKGKKIIEIAQDLKLSDKTISTYRSRIMEKMNFKNTSDIIRYAFQNGLIEL